MTLQEMGGMGSTAVSAELRRFSQALPKQRRVRNWLEAAEKILRMSRCAPYLDE